MLSALERKGEIWILLQVMLFALFPLVVSFVTKIISPLLFAGVSMLLAGTVTFFYLLFTHQWKFLINRKTMMYMLLATLFIGVFPQIFIFIGASKTSAINVALLWQMEIFFTFLICSFWYGERITLQKMVGAFMILLGATVILYQRGLHMNIGDLLIILGTAFFPIGNILTKECLKLVSPSLILFVRSMLGGTLLFSLSMFFERIPANPIPIFQQYGWVFFVNGVLLMGISKLMWYKGLQYLDISKAISLGLSAPAFTLLYTFLFFQEIPSFFQGIGFILVMTGLFVITRKKLPMVEMV